MLRLGTSGLALMALVGCSPVKDTSNVPDAPIDSTDMRPAMIESSDPAANATKVSILQPISVFMDEALDPDSVSESTVKLGYFANLVPTVFPSGSLVSTHGPVSSSGLQYVKGKVSYDAGAKKVSFVPAAPLPYGAVFSLELNVKDKAGLETKTALNFQTFINAPLKQYFFTGANSNPASWLGFPVDAAGRQTKRVAGNQPGPDTIWFTSDDPKNQRYDFKYETDGRVLEERSYNSPATDTPSDVLASCIRYTYNASKQLTERMYTSTPGPDAMLCTADDVPVVNATFAYTDNVLTSWVYYNSPGTDNTWRTPDDRCAVYFDYEYDAKGNKKREIYRGCAADSAPHTADDSYNMYYAYEYDADGYVTKRTGFTSPGTDGMWLTDDDVPGSFFIAAAVSRYTRDANGQVTEELTSTGAGTDGMWGTADDSGSRVTTTYNDHKLATEVTFYSAPGTDGMWGTADDVISNYQVFTYDELGNRTDSKQYVAGVDGAFHTPDDRITFDFDYDLAH